MRDRKGKYIGITGAIFVHLAILALLLLMSLAVPEKEEESGVEVIMGDVEESFGGFDPSALVDVEIDSDPSVSEVEPEIPSEPELITQTEEETVVLTEAQIAAEALKRAEIKAERERKAAEEARRLAKEKAERERKAAEETANKMVAGAFGRGSQMASGQTTGLNNQGASNGSTKGANQGNSGYGTFDLGGRSIGAGGLPRPVYNVQDEGKVVVNITVNPGGFVIATSIHRATNTVNTQLRKAAEDAAKKARFNVVSGVNNQMGTITYYFNLK